MFLKNKTVDLFTYCQLQLFFLKKTKKTISYHREICLLGHICLWNLRTRIRFVSAHQCPGVRFFFISLELLYYFSWLVKNLIGICILFFFFFARDSGAKGRGFGQIMMYSLSSLMNTIVYDKVECFFFWHTYQSCAHSPMR